MSRLQIWFQLAAEHFGLTVDSDYRVDLGEGNTLLAELRVRSVGGAQGMLVFTDFDKIERFRDQLSQLGFGYTVMDEPNLNDDFDIDDTRAMLEDWGWRSK